MEEERFVWSIWRTQVSTLNWIKRGREAEMKGQQTNLTEEGKGGGGLKIATKLGNCIILRQSGLLWWDERALGGWGCVAVLFVKGNWGKVAAAGKGGDW